MGQTTKKSIAPSSHVRAGKIKDVLDYHEGLSPNQIKIILTEFGLNSHIKRFNEWMYGQTAPIIKRYNDKGQVVDIGGVYEYDLFRWIENQKKGTQLIWD